MTPLEMRLICYGLAALLIIGGAGVGGYELAAHHYQRLAAAEQIAQANAVIAQQQKNAALVAQQQAAGVAAEKQYDDLKASATTLGDELADSLREYESLRTHLLPTTASTASEPDAAPAGAGGTEQVATLAGSAATACLGDAAELQALQSWAKSISQVTP